MGCFRLHFNLCFHILVGWTIDRHLSRKTHILRRLSHGRNTEHSLRSERESDHAIDLPSYPRNR